MSNNPLSDFVALIKEDLIHSLQSYKRVATGRTIEALEQVDEDRRSTLYGPEYIDNLEFGRKPTPEGTPAGDPTLVEAISNGWLQARGIPLGKAWAVANSIHKNGYSGTPGVLTTPLGDDNINKRLDETVNQLAELTAVEIADSLHIVEAA